MSYLGALFFEEYAKIWGSKVFLQTHPYLPYFNGKHSPILDLYERQAIEDLKYVVESSQYLPFTRKGTLTLNGDRRLKIGNIIRYKSTGEIFFIDAVQQGYVINENKIDRETTIQVSRGIVEQLIYGKEYENVNGVPQYVGYFNLINTSLNHSKKDVVSQKLVPKDVRQSNISLQS